MPSARPARLWISEGMMIFVALPFAAAVKASSALISVSYTHLGATLPVFLCPVQFRIMTGPPAVLSIPACISIELPSNWFT